ncbi:MAG: aspartyl protease family protein [Chloroflexi bacterium]|nr:aspartyl protease family protein [Chloroflexota bacterium]
MGTFRVAIEIGDPQGQRWETVQALVDTGSSYTVLPRPLLEALKVRPHTRAVFLLADGRQVELELGRAWVRLDSQQEFTLVVFGEDGAQPLLGAVTLEEFRLAPDPVSKRLIPVPGLLM